MNRTIGLSPNEAFQPRNKHVVLYNLEQHYQKSLRKKSKARFKVNTRVRILRLSQNKHFSRKAFTQNLTEEIFTIYNVCNRLPFTRYFIKDEENERIVGSFQAYELTPVRWLGGNLSFLESKLSWWWRDEQIWNIWKWFENISTVYFFYNNKSTKYQ